MALPYVQLETDFIKRKAVTIAAILKVPRQLVVGMASDLFDYVVEETATEANAPDGVLLDPDAQAIIEGVMEWTGEPGKAFDAFVRAGVIEKLEIGARIKGCERYKNAWEKNQRRKPDGNRPVTGKKPDGTGTERKRKIESKKLLPTEVVVRAPLVPIVPFVVEAPVTQPDTWLGEDFWRWAQAKRQKANCVAEKPPHPSKLAAWWSSVRSVVKDVGALKEAFYRFGDDKHWQAATPPLPFAAFISQWEKYMPRMEASHA
jgi:hypothetical protein